LLRLFLRYPLPLLTLTLVFHTLTHPNSSFQTVVSFQWFKMVRDKLLAGMRKWVLYMQYVLTNVTRHTYYQNTTLPPPYIPAPCIPFSWFLRFKICLFVSHKINCWIAMYIRNLLFSIKKRRGSHQTLSTQASTYIYSFYLIYFILFIAYCSFILNS